MYLDGVLAATVNGYRTAAATGRELFAHTWAATAAHTIRITCLGTSGHPGWTWTRSSELRNAQKPRSRCGATRIGTL